MISKEEMEGFMALSSEVYKKAAVNAIKELIDTSGHPFDVKTNNRRGKLLSFLMADTAFADGLLWFLEEQMELYLDEEIQVDTDQSVKNVMDSMCQDQIMKK